MALDSIQSPKPFQAEYEGSIPFTRSNTFNCLGEAGIRIPTKQAESFRQSFPGLFATPRAVDAALNLAE